jgi:hypothetical protein
MRETRLNIRLANILQKTQKNDFTPDFCAYKACNTLLIMPYRYEILIMPFRIVTESLCILIMPFRIVTESLRILIMSLRIVTESLRILIMSFRIVTE